MTQRVQYDFEQATLQLIDRKVSSNPQYASAEEYIANLIDRDNSVESRWDGLYKELKPGVEADESQFVDFDKDTIMARLRNLNAS